MLAPRKKLWGTPDVALDIVRDMLQVGPSDVVYDIGCGDGRFLIAAAKRGARCVGHAQVEIEEARAAEARDNAERAGVSDRVTVIVSNGLECDLSEATALYLYLIPRGLRIILPTLRTCPNRLRVVTYMAPLPGVEVLERRTCTPSHQPDAEYPLFLFHLQPETRLQPADGHADGVEEQAVFGCCPS
ncbi:S-adenosyl-L-methionine-dependent methyltransferase [Pelagophyceae sp. CCMP2097]|nr:S-adenosyl-L-methionine-dependent methyltransferase [Pelagophyceae sp. CCMP2097]